MTKTARLELAAALLLALAGPRARVRAMLGLGWLVFVGTLVWLATFPVSIAL